MVNMDMDLDMIKWVLDMGTESWVLVDMDID